MHCASLLRTIFALLARANKRVHVHNERNFPHAKLGNEINVGFLLNEVGKLYFLLHNSSVHIILLEFKKIKNYRKEKKIGESAQNRYSVMQIKALEIWAGDRVRLFNCILQASHFHFIYPSCPMSFPLHQDPTWKARTLEMSLVWNLKIVLVPKTTTLRTLYVHVVLNWYCDFSTNFMMYDIVLYSRHFLPVKFFSEVLLWINYVSSYRKMKRGTMNNAHD